MAYISPYRKQAEHDAANAEMWNEKAEQDEKAEQEKLEAQKEQIQADADRAKEDAQYKADKEKEEIDNGGGGGLFGL